MGETKSKSSLNMKALLSKKEFKRYSKLNPFEKIIYKSGYIEGRLYELNRLSKELK